MTRAEAPARAVMSRRSLIIGAASGLTALAAYAGTPRRTEHRLAKERLGELVPAMIGPWTFRSSAGVVVARADEAVPADGYDQVIARSYDAPDLPSVMLLVAYGSTQSGNLRLHRPETCYPAQGFSLSDFSDCNFGFAPNSLVEARRFTATRGDRIERLVYWTRIGDSFPRSTADEYRAILHSVLSGVVPDGVLVRVSTLTSDLPAADAAIDRFAGDLVRSLPLAGTRILLGDSIAAALGRTGAARGK